MMTSFFHTGFVVKDLGKSMDFYVNVLGMRVAGRMERKGGFASQLLAFPDAHIKGAFLDKGGEGHQLELIQYISPASGPGGINRNDLGAAHLAFFVTDIDKVHADTSQRGLKFNNPPAALEDEYGKLLRKALYAQDPDGNWLEFVELF
ncbi:MAG: VOC family protein [Dehalococcoidia bacterium]|nr:VOC family protein [Dehalococcoidia bacterium]